jgi:hypothetical protein
MLLWGEWNYERNITERSGVVYEVECLVNGFIYSIMLSCIIKIWEMIFLILVN